VNRNLKDKLNEQEALKEKLVKEKEMEISQLADKVGMDQVIKNRVSFLE